MREDGESAKIQELIRTLQNEVAASREADQELRRMLRIAREDEGSLRKRLDVADRDRHDLRVKLNKADLERFTLSKQVRVFSFHFFFGDNRGDGLVDRSPSFTRRLRRWLPRRTGADDLRLPRCSRRFRSSMRRSSLGFCGL